MPTRDLTLNSLDDAIAEITRLRDSGYTSTANWNLSQTCEHLTGTMRIGLDGSVPRLPWIQRKVFGAMFRFLIWRRSMPRGAGTLPELVPNERAEDDPALIETCLATLAESRDFPGPLKPYPLMDGMTLEMWKELMTIHAQHHLRLLEPK